MKGAFLFVVALTALLQARGAFTSGRRRLDRSPAWQLAWPAAPLVAGSLLLLHPQQGSGAAMARATVMHRWLGVLLGIAAVTRAAEVVWSGRRLLSVTWPLALVIAAVILMTYREPEDAHEPSHGQRHSP